MARRGKAFNNIPFVIKSMPEAAEIMVEKMTVDVAAGATEMAPVDTGALAESYTWDVEGLEGTAGTNVEYGPYQEYGTRNHGAQPHLTPAAEGVENSIGQYAREMRDTIEEAARGRT